MNVRVGKNYDANCAPWYSGKQKPRLIRVRGSVGVIHAIKHKPQLVLENIVKHNPNDICISSITYGELIYRVEKSRAVERNRMAIIMFLSTISILSFDSNAAEEYGKIRANLEKKGTPIGSMDMLIAAHAKSEKLIVVTNNTREFYRVHDLKVEDWSK